MLIQPHLVGGSGNSTQSHRVSAPGGCSITARSTVAACLHDEHTGRSARSRIARVIHHGLPPRAVGPAASDCGAVSVTPHRQTPALFDGCRVGRGRRSSRWNGSLNRSELEVQFLEAPEQKGGVPFEPTSACRTVLGL